MQFLVDLTSWYLVAQLLLCLNNFFIVELSSVYSSGLFFYQVRIRRTVNGDQIFYFTLHIIFIVIAILQLFMQSYNSSKTICTFFITF